MSGKPIKRVSARKYRGIGDVVATVARPVARALDAIAGTQWTGCAACQKRRAAMNRFLPFR
jgi:hypothetical protein